MGVLCAGRRARSSTLLDLLGTATRVFVEEPAMVKNQGERWWNKVEQRHDRSGIGSLVRPEDIYLSPWELEDRLRRMTGLDLDQLRRGRRARRRPQRAIGDRVCHAADAALSRVDSGDDRGAAGADAAGGAHPA